MSIYIRAANAVRAACQAKLTELRRNFEQKRHEYEAAIRAALIVGLPEDGPAFAVASAIADSLITRREGDEYPIATIPVGEMRALIQAAVAADILPKVPRTPSQTAPRVQCGTCQLYADGSGVGNRGTAEDSHTAAHNAWTALDEFTRETKRIPAL